MKEKTMKNKAWKCIRCGNASAEATREDESLADVMPGVVLMNADVTKCSSCGNREVAIPRMDDLMKLVARTVMMKHGRLNGDEVRFMRSYFGLSGVDFAQMMDSTPATVSRWENGRTPVGRTADLLLRAIATLSLGTELLAASDDRAQAVVDAFRRLAQTLQENARPSIIRVAFQAHGWIVVEAARSSRTSTAAASKGMLASTAKENAVEKRKRSGRGGGIVYVDGGARSYDVSADGIAPSASRAAEPRGSGYGKRRRKPAGSAKKAR